ncbi:macrophage colony-stimulating factor 1 receptor 2 [Gouania willdenowi]|uniref:receptor protein-tyrosine kinase n=2 Tax=Gouania willdenowi TaxID=441366 RepID=A0A8C5DKQ2_GOUWI|nr:macrophage colony-stimulating factor 1 receptor 2-like [Gouania willdenowi]
MCFQFVLLVIGLSCCCAVTLSPLSMHLNSRPLKDGSDVILRAGSAFNLSCHGNTNFSLSSTAWNRLTNRRFLAVRTSTPRHTGTYRCSYTDLSTWIHLYVTDSTDVSSVFVSSVRYFFSLPEGKDFLIKCLLTDPSVTNLTLQSETVGRGLPPGMNVTFDPRRGALIHKPEMRFSGKYVCSGLKDGKRVASKPVQLYVYKKLGCPSVSIRQKEYVRLVGERFEATCVSSNPSHLYNLTWTHPHLQHLNVTVVRRNTNAHLYMNSTVIVDVVSRRHHGVYTCTAVSEFGFSQTMTRLHVLERPYLRTHLQLTWTTHANSSAHSQQISPNSSVLIANISNAEASRANVSSSSVEVVEGEDLMMTFVIEAYPPIRSQQWTLPAHLDTQHILIQQKKQAASDIRSELSLLLRRVHLKDQGHYFFHFSNVMLNVSHRIDLRIYRSPSVSITLDNNTLTCISSGFPPPTVLWFHCPGLQHTCTNVSAYQVSATPWTIQEESNEAELRSHIHLPTDEVTVECVASNLMGESRKVFKARRPNPQTIFTLPLIGALTVVAVLLLLLSVVFHRCRQRPKYEIRWKIIESSDGNNYTFVDPSQLPYNHKWEFPRDKLRLGAVLGSGAFGKVVEAAAYGLETDNKVTKVAVKMLKPSAHSEEREALMCELKILSHLGYHDNIVNLLGACTLGGPMLMITEYCCHGDLLNFLRTHAHNFVTSELNVNQTEYKVFYKNIQEQQARVRSDSGISCCSDYLDMQPLSGPGQTQLCLHTQRLYIWDLLWFSFQVAQGLDFLSSKNCIHRDVAARNVLLTDRCVAKICDFGLARDIQNDDSYIVQGNARLPVKWMSPESIFECVYTVQSDVWSYGVLLWEIFSLGRSPYPNVVVDTNFYQMIKDGRQMEQPDFAPAQIYQLMRLCWSLQPTHRPTFKMIGQHIHRLLPCVNDWLPHQNKQPTYQNICESNKEEKEDCKEPGQSVKREQQPPESRDESNEDELMMKNIYQHS